MSLKVTKRETWNGVPVEFQLLTKGTRRYGEKLRKGRPEFLVVHDTGNINTTAQDNVDYFENTYNIDWDEVASAHLFIDDEKAIVCIPLDEKAWHVLYNTPTDNEWYHADANDAAVGGEICYFTSKSRTLKSLDNAARIFAYLAEKYNIVYQTQMPGHQDIQADKQDPGNALEAAGYTRGTANFDKMVTKYYKAGATSKILSKTEAKPVNKVSWNWSGTFYPDAPKTGIRVRRAPSLNGNVVDKGSWLYTKDDWVKFDQITKANGYWWIRFKYQAPGSNQDYFYCAICKITDPRQKVKNEKYYGTIKWNN